MSDVIKSCSEKMEKVIKNLQHEFSLIRTGRANPHLLEKVQVEYYGSNLPVNQVATITIPEARTIEIKPWDLNALPEIEKAILKSDIGITPQNDGKIIRLILPPLTEERRVELTKIVKKIAESHKVSLRNVRRDVIKELKDMEKEKKISEDERFRKEEEVDKVLKEKINVIDEILDRKVKEIMEV